MKLISGAEALIALAKGKEVEFHHDNHGWVYCSGLNIDQVLGDCYRFRLKPEMVKINLELPKPFSPKENDIVFVPANFMPQGYLESRYSTFQSHVYQFGVFQTVEEVIQVRDALRTTFKQDQ